MASARRIESQWRRPSAFVWFFLVVQLVLGAIGIGAWQVARANAPALPDGPPPEPDASFQLPATLESAYPFAQERARSWRDDATLLAVSEQIEWPGDAPIDGTMTVASGGWLTYVFIAPWRQRGQSTGAASFSVRIDRSGGAIFDERVTRWKFEPDARIPIPGSYRMDSTMVALTAEVTGGKAFRDACPRRRHVSRMALDVAASGATVWTVGYLDDRFPDQYALTVTIDAQSGQIGEVVDRSRPCDAATRGGGRFGPEISRRT